MLGVCTESRPWEEISLAASGTRSRVITAPGFLIESGGLPTELSPLRVYEPRAFRLPSTWYGSIKTNGLQRNSTRFINNTDQKPFLRPWRSKQTQEVLNRDLLLLMDIISSRCDSPHVALASGAKVSITSDKPKHTIRVSFQQEKGIRIEWVAYPA